MECNVNVSNDYLINVQLYIYETIYTVTTELYEMSIYECENIYAYCIRTLQITVCISGLSATVPFPCPTNQNEGAQSPQTRTG